MLVYVSHGQRYPFKAYQDTIPPGWQIEPRLDGQALGEPSSVHKKDGNNLLPYSLPTFEGILAPVPARVGSTFAVRFRNVNTTEPIRAPIVIGNLIFFGA